MDAISGPTVVLDFCSVWEPWVSSSGPQRLVFTAPLTSRAAPCQAMSLLVRQGKEFTPDRLTTGLPTWAGWGPPLSAYNEGRTTRLGVSEFAYLHFHFESISTQTASLRPPRETLSHYRWAEPAVLNLFLQLGFRNQLCRRFGSWEVPSLFTPECFP